MGSSKDTRSDELKNHRFVRYEFGKYRCGINPHYIDHIYIEPTRIVSVSCATMGQKDSYIHIEGRDPYYVNLPAAEVIRLIVDAESKADNE